MGQQGQQELYMLHDCPHVAEDRNSHTEVGHPSVTTALEQDAVGWGSTLRLLENDAPYSFLTQERYLA